MYLGDSEIRFALDLGRDNFKAEPGVTRIGVRRTLSKKQENQLIAIDAFAKKYGLTIIVTPKLYANGQTLREYANGVENGKVIILSLAAEDNALTVAAFHEAFHMLPADVKTPLINDMIRQLITDEGENFRNIFYQRYALYNTTTAEDKASLKETLKELDFDGDVMAQLADLFGEKELADTYEEIAAQYAGTLLSRDDVLAELAEKNPTGLKKFVEEIKKFLTEVRNYIAYLAKHDETAAAALRKDAKEAANLAERITDALENSEFEQSGAEKYSIKTDINGIKYVDVDVDAINMNSGRSVASVIAALIKEKFNNRIVVNKQVIQINKTTNDKWTWGESSRYFRKYEKQKFHDKVKSIANADEILIAARNWIGEEKHHKRDDDIIEFARGEVYFKVGDNGYVADVLVATRKNGAAVLYDLEHIYEKKITEARPTAVNDSSLRARDTSVENSISNSSEKSNTENEENSSSHKSLQTTDAEYMDAVNRGDMETAQRMVDEAAKSKAKIIARRSRSLFRALCFVYAFFLESFSLRSKVFIVLPSLPFSQSLS